MRIVRATPLCKPRWDDVLEPVNTVCVAPLGEEPCRVWVRLPTSSCLVLPPWAKPSNPREMLRTTPGPHGELK